MNELTQVLIFILVYSVVGAILVLALMKAYSYIKKPETRIKAFILSAFALGNSTFTYLISNREREFEFGDAIAMVVLNSMFLTFYLLRKSKYFTKDLKDLVGKSKE